MKRLEARSAAVPPPRPRRHSQVSSRAEDAIRFLEAPLPLRANECCCCGGLLKAAPPPLPSSAKDGNLCDNHVREFPNILEEGQGRGSDGGEGSSVQSSRGGGWRGKLRFASPPSFYLCRPNERRRGGGQPVGLCRLSLRSREHARGRAERDPEHPDAAQAGAGRRGRVGPDWIMREGRGGTYLRARRPRRVAKAEGPGPHLCPSWPHLGLGGLRTNALAGPCPHQGPEGGGRTEMQSAPCLPKRS